MSNDNPFNIIGSDSVPQMRGQSITEENQAGDLNERIKRLIASADIFLFMKGTPEFPQCGFSANVIGMQTVLMLTIKPLIFYLIWTSDKVLKISQVGQLIHSFISKVTLLEEMILFLKCFTMVS